VAGFINKLPGGIEVIHRPAAKDWGDVDLSSPPKGCGHTTETTSLPSYREGQRDAPTFTVGFDKVWQHRGLGKSCGTLQNLAGGVETNRLIRIQFELIGSSTRESWLPAGSFQREALAAIKELAHDELDVPPGHAWPDKQDDGDRANMAYPRRHSKFPSVPGWYGHIEIPENEHWDWGSLRWDDLDAGPAMTDALAFVERFRKATDGGKPGRSLRSSPAKRYSATGRSCQTARPTPTLRTNCAALCSTHCARTASGSPSAKSWRRRYLADQASCPAPTS